MLMCCISYLVAASKVWNQIILSYWMCILIYVISNVITISGLWFYEMLTNPRHLVVFLVIIEPFFLDFVQNIFRLGIIEVFYYRYLRNMWLLRRSKSILFYLRLISHDSVVCSSTFYSSFLFFYLSYLINFILDHQLLFFVCYFSQLSCTPNHWSWLLLYFLIGSCRCCRLLDVKIFLWNMILSMNLSNSINTFIFFIKFILIILDVQCWILIFITTNSFRFLLTIIFILIIPILNWSYNFIHSAYFITHCIKRYLLSWSLLVIIFISWYWSSSINLVWMVCLASCIWQRSLNWIDISTNRKIIISFMNVFRCIIFPRNFINCPILIISKIQLFHKFLVCIY